MKIVLLGVLFLLLCLVGLYWASPLLIAAAGPQLADRLQLSLVELDVDRPAWRSLNINYLRVVGDGFNLTAQGGQLTYNWRQLRQRQFDAIHFDSLILTVTQGQSDTTAATEIATPIDPDTIFNALDAAPLSQALVSNLTLELKQIGFIAHGTASANATSVKLKVNGAQPVEASHFQLDLELSPEQLAAMLYDRDSSTELLNLKGKFDPNTINLEGHFDLSGYGLTLGSALAGLPQGQGRTAGTFTTSLPWPIPTQLNSDTMVVEIPDILIDWRADDKKLELDNLAGSLRFDKGELRSSVAGTLRMHSNLGRATLTLPPRYQLTYQPEGIIGGAGAQLVLLHPELNLHATVDAVSVGLAAPHQISLNANLSATTDALTATGNIGTTLQLQSTEAAQVQGKLAFDGELQAAKQRYKAKINADFARDGDNVNVLADVSTSIFSNATTQLNYQLSTGHGSFSASDNIRVRAPLLATLVPDWTADYDLTGGNIDAAMHLQWQSLSAITTRVTLEVSQGTGHYQDYHATGINGPMRLEAPHLGALNTFSLKPSVLQVQKLDLGIPLTNVTLRTAWSGDTVTVTRATGALLGGAASVAPFTYDLAKASTTFNLSLSDIQLAEILALEGDDILGTGKLDAQLPVSIDNDGVRILDGRFNSQPPGGVIQLQPSFSGATQQPGLEFALLALKDFRYTHLGGEANYETNGDLELTVQLRGSNPAVEKNRPIHYNLTITENIPALIQSLRLKDRAAERIEAKVRQ